MEILLLAFANSRTEPLQTLTDEYLTLSRTLAPRALRQHFLLHPLSHAALDDVAFYLTLFRDRLSLFLFSGHAGRDALLLEGETARAEGIAHLLGQCPNLKTVVLNGCSTLGQVRALHAAGVPLVVATAAPVDDAAASRFSMRLFQALEAGLDIGEAFEQGIGEAMARTPGLAVHRAIGSAAEAGMQAGQSLWGIFPNPGMPGAVRWRLPFAAAPTAQKQDFVENEELLQTLYDTLAGTNSEVKKLQDEGATLDERRSDILLALLKSLPAPISEHLRKLVLPPFPGSITAAVTGPERLGQIARTYQICMDFLAFVLMAQLWENILPHEENGKIGPEKTPGFSEGQISPLPAPAGAWREALHAFLDRNATLRRDADYFSLLRLLHGEALRGNAASPFIPEFDNLRAAFTENEAVKNACFFLETLRRTGVSAPPAAAEMQEQCERAEASLALVFSKLGFLGRYLLATVRNIDVQKYRHTEQAQFEHMVVKWHGTQGIYDKEYRREANFMDNRSVVLLRLAKTPAEGPEKTPGDAVAKFLNLSPFIIDENTFERVPDTSLAKLYFFAGREGGRLFYKFVNEPETDVIDLDDAEFFDKKKKRTKFYLAKDQFDAFCKAIFEPTAAAELP